MQHQQLVGGEGDVHGSFMSNNMSTSGITGHMVGGGHEVGSAASSGSPSLSAQETSGSGSTKRRAADDLDALMSPAIASSNDKDGKGDGSAQAHNEGSILPWATGEEESIFGFNFSLNEPLRLMAQGGDEELCYFGA